MKLLFLDTETTGLPKKWGRPATEVDNWPRVVEVGVVSIDTEARTVMRAGTLIQPDGFEIPPEASAVHGITTQIAAEKGSHRQVVFGWVHGLARTADRVIGHNIKFDVDCIGAEFHRLEYPLMPLPTICTMFGTKHMFGKWPKLAELYKKVFAKDFEDAHRALSDITATAECFLRLVEVGLWPDLEIQPELAGDLLSKLSVSRETIGEIDPSDAQGGAENA